MTATPQGPVRSALARDAASLIRERAGAAPLAAAIVLGSGLGNLAERVRDAVTIPYEDVPGFERSGVSGHQGALVFGELGGKRVALLKGRVHFYESGNARAMLHPLETLCELGVDRLLLTNAAGSLREAMQPGAVMMITDHISYSGRNPLIGTTGDQRFVNMVDAYDPTLRAALRDTADEGGIPMSDGVYMWFSGPSFETPAEIRAAQILGADAVGMSTVPEVILARYLGLKVAALSLITNMGAGLSSEVLSHEHTQDMAAKGAETVERLAIGFVEHLA